MKMRGHSVLFVSALCVFVLCGAVVAYNKTPETKALEAAKAMTDTAKRKGDEALDTHERFASNVSSVLPSLSLAFKKITVLKIQTSEIERTKDQKKEQILWEIDWLEEQAVTAKVAVGRLVIIRALKMGDVNRKRAPTKYMKEVDEIYMAVMKKAGAAVTGNISAIDAVIEKTVPLFIAAIRTRDQWGDVGEDFEKELFKAREAVSALNTSITFTKDFLNLFDGGSDPEAQKVNEELSDALENILKPSLEKMISLRYASHTIRYAARDAFYKYYKLEQKVMDLKEAAENWRLGVADVKVVEAARADADTAKTKGDEALKIVKKFASDVSSVVSNLTLAIGKITASKIPAGKIMQGIKDVKREQILREIDELKTKAETAVESLKESEAWTLKDEQTKTALTNKMKEVELYMTEVVKAAAAVTGNISAIDAVIGKAGALVTAAEAAGYLWHSAVYDLDARLSRAMAAVSAVYTTITSAKIFLFFFGGSSDPGAQKVNEELSDAVKSILTPSLEKLISLRDALQKAKMAARKATEEYRALAKRAKQLKKVGEIWKLRAADVKAVEAAKADADAARAKGAEAFAVDRKFASNVYNLMLDLILAYEKIGASKIPAGKIMRDIKDIKKERILRIIDGLKTRAEAVNTAVEELRDGEAETFKDEQKKTALTNGMKEVELNMADVVKAAAAVAGNISAIDAVIEKAGALVTAAEAAASLWHSAASDLMIQLSSAMAVVKATITVKGKTESAVTKLGSNSDQEAQEVKKELSDIIESILTPSLEALISLRDASQNAAEYARKAEEQYGELKKKAMNLKEAAEDWKQRAADVKAVEAAKVMADRAKTKGDEALAIDEEFEGSVFSVMFSLDLAVGKITASKIPAGKTTQEIKDIKKEQILRIIDWLNIKAEAANTAVEALMDAGARVLNDEQTKTALKNRMKEVELNMTEVEKAAAAVTGNIFAIDAVIEKAGALVTAAEAAGYLWNDAMFDLFARFERAFAAASAVDTTITDTEGFLDFFDGGGDPEAQKVKKELSDAVESLLKPSLEALMFLQNASQNAAESARETTDLYEELEEKAMNLKEAAEVWKLRAADVKTVEAAKADADTAKTKGDEALKIVKRFASHVYNIMMNLTLAVEKISASKIPAGDIMQEIKDIKREQILQKFSKLQSKAGAAVEALKDGEAETLKDEQTKTALTNGMREVELNMADVVNAAAAVAGNISAIDTVIEKAGALETAARKAWYLWHSAVSDLTIQLSSAMAAVSATITLKGEMESAVAKLESNSDQEAQEVKKELSDIIESILTPSLEKLISLRDASEKAKLAALKATGEYRALKEKAKELKKVGEDRRRDVQKVLGEGRQVSQGPPPSAAN